MLLAMTLQSATSGEPLLEAFVKEESSQSLMEPRIWRELESSPRGLEVTGAQLAVASRAAIMNEVGLSILGEEGIERRFEVVEAVWWMMLKLLFVELDD
jgi:hypothetical protein